MNSLQNYFFYSYTILHTILFGINYDDDIIALKTL